MIEIPQQKVALFGVPRSGTTWVGQLINAAETVAYRYQPLFSYEFKDFLNPSSTAREIESFYEAIFHAESDFVLPVHDFIKSTPTHLVFKSVRYHNLAKPLLERSQTKIIFIHRPAVDVINSWFNAPREFYPEWNIYEEWEDATLKNQGRPEEFFGFNKWCEAQMIHRKNAKDYPDRVFLLDYEKATQDPLTTYMELFEWLELPWTNQVESFLSATTRKRHSTQTYSVFKAPAERTLPEDLQKEIQKRSEDLLSHWRKV